MKQRRRRPVVDRFWEKVSKLGGFPDFSDPLVRVSKLDGECWIWTAAKNKHGYGVFCIEAGRVVLAHRFANGLDKLEYDHLCRRPACIKHVEPVGQVENALRGDSPPARNSRKTECKSGHPFTPENTYKRSDKKRECRICRVNIRRRFYAEKRR